MIKQVRFRRSNSDAVTDTWEDKVELHTRFPATAAWGQATTQEEGDVSAPDKAGPSTRTQVASDARAKRPRIANPRVSGPDWVTAAQLLPPTT